MLYISSFSFQCEETFMEMSCWFFYFESGDDVHYFIPMYVWSFYHFLIYGFRLLLYIKTALWYLYISGRGWYALESFHTNLMLLQISIHLGKDREHV